MKLKDISFLLGILKDEKKSLFDTERALYRKDLTRETRAWFEGEFYGQRFMVAELEEIDISNYDGIWLKHGTILIQKALDELQLKE